MIKASWGGGGKGIRKVGFLFQLNCGNWEREGTTIQKKNEVKISVKKLD